MPDKTFSFSSMAITSEGHVLGSPQNTYPGATGSWSLNTTNLTEIEFTASGSYTRGGVGATLTDIRISLAYQKIISIDYTQPIFGLAPGVTISKVVFRVIQFFTLQSNTTAALGGDLAGSHINSSFLPSLISVSLGNYVAGSNTKSSSNTSSGSPDLTMFDNPGSPITRSTLISTYGTVTLRVIAEARSDVLVNWVEHADCSISSGIDSFEVIVTYQDPPWTWELADPPQGRSIEPASTMRWTSNPSDPFPLDFTSIDTVTAKTYDAEGNLLETFDVPPPDWLIYQPFEFEIQLPDWTNEPQILVIEIIGTTFTGSMELQRAFPVQFYNAPGVYTFVEGRTHDTYYDRDSDPITTVDTKIPNPTGRTGFY